MEEKRSVEQIIQARVLVVDDDPILRTQIKRLASQFVSEIRLAADGVEGLEIWRQWQPNVVVTDIFMPRMSGLEMSAAIKAGDPDAQIIVITSDDDGDSLRRALEIGVERYISKPVDMHLLADAISKCVRDQQQTEDLRLTRQVAALTEALQQQLWEKLRAEEALNQEKAEQRVLINRLEEAHNQLLQSEKMASIGQLAAGVAHEINNPISYVNSNLGALQQYVGKLLQLIAGYEQHDAELPGASRDTLDALKREIDLDYLRNDVGDLLAESLGGLQRVKRIVQDLKDFSHVSDSEMQWANLENGLESTLNVVGNELKYKAEVVRDYGHLPEIECIPSQLNQVFMNLLVNASQAIAEHGVITLRTRQEGDQACLEISDTGSGIPPEIINRIFDPFFTTKPVGTGTGLGLSITHGIIRKHGGRIEVSSEIGKGSTFRIVLPIRQNEPELPA
ncbi:MAG: histidine kinase [Proteobacteria bacterium]|nr:histidine kinase [Pseudomonadota bacterium]